MKISFCVGRSAPPDSTSEIVGRLFSSAICEARKIFLTVQGLRGAALHGRVVGADHALDALDHPDAGHDRGADGEVGAPAGQRRQLEERRARVDEQLDPLAGGQLAAGVVAVDVLLAAAGHRDGVLGVEVGDLLQHRLAVRRRHSTPPPPSSAPASCACRSRLVRPRSGAEERPVERASAATGSIRKYSVTQRPAVLRLEAVAPVVDRHRVGADGELEDLLGLAGGDPARRPVRRADAVALHVAGEVGARPRARSTRGSTSPRTSRG